MATQEIKDLLLEAGPFARLSASEQRTRLVRYYEPWFTPGWKPDTVNNIRCTQRLVTHSKLMAMSVGVVLQAILEEASGRSPAPTVEQGSRGLLDVEPDDIDRDPTGSPVGDYGPEPDPDEISQPEPTADAPQCILSSGSGSGDAHTVHPNTPSRSRSRSNRVK